MGTSELPGTFPSRRAAFALDHVHDVALVRLSVASTLEGQAEGLLLNGERMIVSDVNITGSGDALQTTAYETLAKLQCQAEARVRIIEEIARATGSVEGMIGGQMMDLEAERSQPDGRTLERIHRYKTGALITASLVTGGIYANGSHAEIQRLRDFGRAIGLAFQIVDDVLDVTESSQQLGKTAGKDTATRKATYPALFGVDASLKQADQLVATGCAALDSFGARAQTLKDLAHFLAERKQ